MKKSIYQKLWNEYPDIIESFLDNRFRSNTDLNLATFLVPWVMYYEGKSIVTPEICYYFNIRSANAPTQYQKILLKKQSGQQPHSFCANDFNSEQKHLPNYKYALESMLKEYYSVH